MSALDVCEPPIIRALQKDGWRIAAKPLSIRYASRYVYADLRISRQLNGRMEEAVVVEIKCFTDPGNDLQNFYIAIGQYSFYRMALYLDGMPYPLYLALPAEAYQRLFSERAIAATFQHIDVKLVVIDIDREEILQWTR